MIEQVEQLKLNAKNIRSSLVSSNARMKKLRLKRSKLLLDDTRRDKIKKKEKKIESTSGTFGRSLKNIGKKVLSKPIDIMSKVTSIASLLLLGVAINNMEVLAEKVKEIFNKIVPPIKGFFEGVVSIYKGARDFIKTINENPMVEGIKDLLGGKQLNLLKDEAKRLEAQGKEFNNEAKAWEMGGMANDSNLVIRGLARMPESNLRDIKLKEKLNKETQFLPNTKATNAFKTMILDSNGLVELRDLTAGDDGSYMINIPGASNDKTREWMNNNAESYGFRKLNDNQYKFVGSQVSLSSNKTNDIGQLPAGSGNGTTVLVTRQLVIT